MDNSINDTTRLNKPNWQPSKYNQFEGRLDRTGTHDVTTLDEKTGKWVPAIPAPYYHRPLSWLWKRVNGYRDEHGRKAQLLTPIWEWFRKDL